MISGIELRNWKTHGETRLSFQKGVNVLIGIMGAGKSSVMEAISFALFGTFPMLKQRRVKLEGMIKSRPSKEDEAQVKLTFVVGSDTYTVTRKISSDGGTMARLDKNGAHLQTQPIRVNEEIASILKVDYDTFARAIYAEQNGLDYFLSIAKGDRKKQIDNMLGLDQFATAEENCKSLINSIKASAESEETVLNSMDIKTMRAQLDKSVEAKDNAAKELALLKERKKKEELELKKVQESLDLQKKLYKKKDELSRKSAELKSKIEILHKEISKIDSKIKNVSEGALKKELDSLILKEKEMKQLVTELERDSDKLKREMASLQTSLNNDERRLSEKKKLANEIEGKDGVSLEKKLKEETSSLDMLVNAEALARNRLEELNSTLKELQKHLAKCPVCERELGPELCEKLISEKCSSIEKTRDEIAKSGKLVETKRKDVKKINDELAAHSLASSRLKDYFGVEEVITENKNKLEALNKDVEKAGSSLEKKKREIEELRDVVQKTKASLGMFEKRKEHQDDIFKYSELVESSEKEAGSIKAEQKDVDILQARFTEQSAALADVSATISGSEKQYATLESRVLELVKQIDNIRELEQRLERQRALVKNLNNFKSALVETEAFLRARLTQSINSLMQGIWPELYPYADYTKLRLSAKPDDYLLEASLQNGSGEEWVQVDAVASGGERSIACLAMRIALSMVIVPNLKWLILDEPTHNIDSSGISKMVGVLSDTLPRVVEQVFIITHDENLRQITSAKVYQLERDKGVAGPTLVSEL